MEADMVSMDLKFIADDHLGKLAKYLRIVGLDCLYCNTISDEELMDLSKKENRVILSSDWNLYRFVPSQRYLFMKSQSPLKQLKEVCDHFKVNPFEKIFKRCLVCNALLNPVDKKDVESIVPPRSYKWKEEFWQCSGCKRVYWPGTHHDAMMKNIRNIFSK